MGGGGSKSTPTPPPAPVVNVDPYPSSENGLKNLSLARGITTDCSPGLCALTIDSSSTTSSLILTREFGEISPVDCAKYTTDYNAVKNKEMSFQDFIANLQNGMYSRPSADTTNGQFCEQISMDADKAAKLSTLEQYDAAAADVKSIRVRKAAGGGGYSSDTKAKFTLSIPVKVRYSEKGTPQYRREQRQVKGRWTWITVPTGEFTPSFRDENISTITLYHPSPLRIENVQHDAVLSLNDPSDPNAKVVILIPLKSSNMVDNSVTFFNKIAKYVTTLASPDPVTNQYRKTNVPTGNDWNVRSIFSLKDDVDENGNPISNQVAFPVENAFYSWEGGGTWERYKKSEVTGKNGGKTITFGWRRSVQKRVTYFMLAEPVSISPTDLSFITRSLPQTPPEKAIHGIPDPLRGGTKLRYKKATGKAVSAECSIGREKMTNPGDILGSVLTGGGVEDMLVDETGAPLADKDSCDPFKNNAKKLMKNPSLFTPTKVFSMFFNILLVVAVALGAWIALYFVARKDYDYTYREFSETAGKVLGKLAMQTSGRAGLLSTAPAADAPVAPAPVAEGLPEGLPKGLTLPKGLALPKGLPSLTSLFGKKTA